MDDPGAATQRRRPKTRRQPIEKCKFKFSASFCWYRGVASAGRAVWSPARVPPGQGVMPGCRRLRALGEGKQLQLLVVLICRETIG